MEREITYIYDKWVEGNDEEQKALKKAFQFRGMGMLIGYIVFLVFIIASILCNVFFQKINIWFIGIFLIICLATVAGIGNQVKIVRQMKQRKFEIRDGIVKKINYSNKRKSQITSYELEIKERNVLKTLVVVREYKTFRPKLNDHVLLARPERTGNIYFYRLLERKKEV